MPLNKEVIIMSYKEFRKLWRKSQWFYALVDTAIGMAIAAVIVAVIWIWNKITTEEKED
jgi:hypothetical protein